MIPNRDKILTFRVTDEEKDLIEQIALISKKRKTDFIRDIVLKECAKLEKKHGRLFY